MAIRMIRYRDPVTGQMTSRFEEIPDQTPEEIAAVEDETKESIVNSVPKWVVALLFNHHNRIRKLENPAAVDLTPLQFRNMVIKALINLNDL